MKYYTTTVQLHIDPFEARDEKHAEEIIDGYLDLITEFANSLTNTQITWEECDTTPLKEADCPTCYGNGEVIAGDANGNSIGVPCPDCED